MGLLLILLVVGGLVFALSRMNGGKSQKQVEQTNFDDAVADARRWIDRLGSQVLTLSGTDAASTQAIADASERFNAASSQISQATTVRQAQLARESALEGLHYVNAAREIMGLPAGPQLPPLEGQRAAGRVTETRTVTQDGQTITASPVATDATPNYYPGGTVAGRPVPAGWYSRPWWAEAMVSGVWTGLSVAMFSSLFHGMSGIGYSADAWEHGYGDGYADGLEAAGADAGDMGDGGDFGGDGGDAGDGGGFFDNLFGGDSGDSGGDGGDGGDGFLGGLFGGDGDGGFDFDF
ncbi:hypothetical protein [Corynebacterium vitaeruminis]|uniref:DUF1542 domain-containing protein n=1 Tax=Corynebacterium vitaeruminis DSM 20294 TaxID=1224164 RepID=W5Y2H6_9CORY|nr:hypothetical protein [Corynebacterium vitaeruminis]AHI23387.1 hypothetical protein B843_10010 [Corynebacterium vitaeruminis DSM 20294]